MIPGDLLSAFPHRQFHTLPGLLDCWAALPNSYPNALLAMQGGSLYHFYDGLWYDPAERRTHDLPCERRTRYRLSQPDTVWRFISHIIFDNSIVYTMPIVCKYDNNDFRPQLQSQNFLVLSTAPYSFKYKKRRCCYYTCRYIFLKLWFLTILYF